MHWIYIYTCSYSPTLSPCSALQKDPDKFTNLFVRIDNTFSKDSTDCIATLSAATDCIQFLVAPPEPPLPEEGLPPVERTLVMRPSELQTLLRWKDDDSLHPIVKLVNLLEEYVKEEESLRAIFESVTAIVNLLRTKEDEPTPGTQIKNRIKLALLMERSSAVIMILTVLNKQVLVFHEKGFQLLAPPQCQKMIGNANMHLCFLENNSVDSLNTKMPSYQYRNSHYKNKTVWRPSYLYNGNIHTWKSCLYIETGLSQSDLIDSVYFQKSRSLWCPNQRPWLPSSTCVLSARSQIPVTSVWWQLTGWPCPWWMSPTKS